MLLIKLFSALNKRRVRYLVAGGVASVLYGNPRFTKDLDLWVDLEEKNLEKLVETFTMLKFIPRIPVKAKDFISRENRQKWMREKGMLAFTFINPKNPFENVDILIKVPLLFEKAYRRRKVFKSGSMPIPTVSREDLIAMKKKAGRLQDLQDKAVKHKISHSKLIVTEEAISDFSSLSTSQRLQWLDEMRAFLSKTLPPKTKRRWGSARLWASF